MKYRTQIQYASASAIIASVCWIIGDILLYGFNLHPENFPLLSKDYASHINDIDLAVYMLEGSTNRLMSGALIAAMSVFLWLPAMWLAYQLFRRQQSGYATLTYYLLLTGTVLSPLGHASIFYVGEIYKTILQTDTSSHPYLLNTANDFVKMFRIAWTSAICFLALGWLLMLIGITLKKTILPSWSAVFNPIIFTMVLIPVSRLLPAPFNGWVNGAVFNIAHLFFFITLFAIGKRKLNLKN